MTKAKRGSSARRPERWDLVRAVSVRCAFGHVVRRGGLVRFGLNGLIICGPCSASRYGLLPPPPPDRDGKRAALGEDQ